MRKKKTAPKTITTEKVEIFVFFQQNHSFFPLKDVRAMLRYETNKKEILDLIDHEECIPLESLSAIENFTYDSELHSGKREFLKKILASEYLESVDEDIQKLVPWLHKLSQKSTQFKESLLVFKRTTTVTPVEEPVGELETAHS